MKQFEINDEATFTTNGTEYKLAGLYFKAVDFTRKNDCMTDFDLNPIAFVPCQRLNTSFFEQPKMAEVEVKKYQVVYKINGEGDWRFAGLRYSSIAEFSSLFPSLTPCKLLE